MARETWVQSQVESYQRLKKWYLMPPCLTLSIIRYGSRAKWSNPGKGVAPSPTPWCSKLSKREPSGHPRLWSPTLLLISTECPIFMTLCNRNIKRIKKNENIFYSPVRVQYFCFDASSWMHLTPSTPFHHHFLEKEGGKFLSIRK